MTQAIFLSYASQDADAARRICDALRAEGLEVWFDQNELRGGDAWDQKIRRQIKECAIFVPIISDNTNARPEGYFRLEWKLAVDRSHLMADNVPFFFPVLLDDAREATALVPDRFRERQWTRISSDHDLSAFANRLAKVVSKDDATQAPVPLARSGQPSFQVPSVSTGQSLRRKVVVGGAAVSALGALAAWWWKPWQPGIGGADATLGLRPKDPQLKRAQDLIDAIDGLPSEVHTAEELVKSVLATRPTDPEAVIMMSRVQNYFLLRGFDVTEARFALAKDYAERSMALAPESAVAKACLSEYLQRRGVDIPRAKQLVDEAIAALPDLPRLHRLRAAIVSRDFSPESLEPCTLVEQVAVRFPDDALSQYNVGLCYGTRLEFGKATHFYERAIATGPVSNGFTMLASLKLWVDGEPDQASALLRQVPDKLKSEQRAVLVWYAYSCLGGEAQAGLDALRALPSEWVKDPAYTGPTGLLFGELLLRDGKPALAKTRFEEALVEWEKRKLEVIKSRREAWLQPYLLMRLGRTKEARAAYRVWTDEMARPYRLSMAVNWWMWSPITIGLMLNEESTAIGMLSEASRFPPAKRVLQTVFKADWRLAAFRNDAAIARILAA